MRVRVPLYRKLIGSGQMKPGYACDNGSGTVERVMEPDYIE